MSRRSARTGVGGALALVAAALILAGCGGTVREPRAAGAAPPAASDLAALHQAAGTRVAVEQTAVQRSAKSRAESAKPKQPKPEPKRSVPGVTFAAVGDTMLGNSPELPADPGSYLDPVRSQLKADAVFGNLEGTLTDESYSPKCGGSPGGDCYAFRTPPSYARDLAAAGFTVMNDANNHSSDFGPAGLADTIAALHRAGIEQTGLPGQITVVKAGGEKVAFLGFAPYATTASLLDLPAARALIRRAGRRADIVVVAIHAGAEGTGAQHVTGAEESYLGEDRGNPERFAQMAVRAGADLILGSGPHVLRGMQIYRGRLIAYSLGNFSGFHNFDISGTLGASAVLHVTLDPDGRFRSGRIASVRMVEAGRPTLDPSGEGARIVAELSHGDFGAGGVRVGGRGRILGKRGG